MGVHLENVGGLLKSVGISWAMKFVGILGASVSEKWEYTHIITINYLMLFDSVPSNHNLRTEEAN